MNILISTRCLMVLVLCTVIESSDHRNHHKLAKKVREGIDCDLHPQLCFNVRRSIDEEEQALNVRRSIEEEEALEYEEDNEIPRALTHKMKALCEKNPELCMWRRAVEDMQTERNVRSLCSNHPGICMWRRGLKRLSQDVVERPGASCSC